MNKNFKILGIAHTHKCSFYDQVKNDKNQNKCILIVKTSTRKKKAS